MAKYTRALQRLQEVRLEHTQIYDNTSDLFYQKSERGFINGISAAESILFEEQERVKAAHESTWHTGSPNDIKPNNSADYILILKAHFDSEDGIEKDHIYISQDYWNGENWEGYEIGEDKWEVLYFAKLKWLHLTLPKNLGVKWNDDLFLK